MERIIDASEIYLKKLISYFEKNKDIFYDKDNQNANIDPNTRANLEKLLKILSQFEKMAETQTIIEFVRDHRFRIEDAIGERISLLQSSITQLEGTIDISLAENNNMITPYINHLIKEREIKLAQLEQLNYLKHNPSIFVSHVLKYGKSNSNIDVNDLIQKIASADPYINQSFYSFVSKDKQTGDMHINEPNVLLGIEVLGGNSAIYDLLLKSEDYRKKITDLSSINPLTTVKSFMDLVNQYNATYELLSGVSNDLTKKQMDYNYKRGGFRIQHEITELGIRKQHYINKLISLLSQIKSAWLFFENSGLNETLTGFEELRTILNTPISQYQTNPYFNGRKKIPTEQLTFLYVDLRMAALKRHEEKIQQFKKALAEHEAQIPPQFEGVDIASVSKIARSKRKTSDPQVLSETEISLMSLLVISGFRKGVKINEILLDEKDKSEILNEAPNLLDDFLNRYVHKEEQNLGKQY